MLGVTFTSRAVLEDGEARRKKDKKEKKKKKEKRSKKEKREKRAAGDSSDESGSDGDAEPRGPSPDDVRGGPAAAGDTEVKPAMEAAEPALQREDWMTKPMKREPSKAAQEAEEREREEEERRRKEAEPEIVAGLRIMKKPDTAAAGAGAEAGAPRETGPAAGLGGGGRAPGGGGGLVGDGGASWRLKALRRAQEQARAEGRSLQEVVGERWGSLAQLTGDLTATVAADGRAHLRAAAERRRAAADGAPAPVLPHYLQDVRSDRAKMMRPSEDASLSWRGDRDRDGRGRREDRPTGREEDANRGRDRDGDRVSEREREPGDDRTREEERRNHGSERERDDRGGDRGRSSEEARDQRPGGQRSLERVREGRGGETDAGAKAAARDRDGDLDRDRHRDRHRDRDRDADRGRDRDRERDAGRDRERDRVADRGRHWERDRDRADPRVGPRPSREQAAALQQLAGSLNTFADDGSFMARFMSTQQPQQQQQQQEEGRAQRPRVKEEDRDSDEEEEEEGRREARRGDDAGPAGMDVDMGDDDDPRVGRGGLGSAAAGPAGPGPSSAQGAAAAAAAAGNRGVAALLRSRAGGSRPAGNDAAAGSGGGGRGGGGAGEEDTTTAAPRRAPLFVGGGGDDDGGGAGSSRTDASGAGADGGGAVVGNKSAAELLRARLKGLPPPSVGGGAGGAGGAAAAVKAEPVEADARGSRAPAAPAAAGPSGRRGGPGRGGDADSDGGDGGDRDAQPRREVVQLPLVDAAGRAVRGAFGREAAGAGVAPNAGRRAGTKPPQRYNRETGEKERYFADDDKVDLQTMLRRAKYGDDDMDMDEHLAANIAKKRKFRGTELDVDAEYDYDGGLEMYESRSKRGNAEAQRNRERSRQVADLRRQAAAEAACALCLSNPHRPKHLTIALGTCTYLCLPARGRLVRGHCCIAPAEHCPSIRGLDEAAWTETKNFIKCLVRMYGAQGQSVIFMETYMPSRGGGRHHAVLDAVPVTERQLEKARGYFKKAILEAESEWSTHHAKACIETTAQKGLRESIPPNFPYFYVQFGYGSGYVHVIDNESKFDPEFGRQVLIGLLDLPPEMAYQRHKAESMATQQQWVREFESQWDPFDWTRQLDAA